VNGFNRNLVYGAVAVVLLAVAAVLYITRSGSSAAQIPRRVTTYGVCLACQQEAVIAHATADVPPFECPHCGERAVYRWCWCLSCKTRFVPNLVRHPESEYPGMPVVPICPTCGSDRCRSYTPGVEVAEDAPLPPWPQ